MKRRTQEMWRWLAAAFLCLSLSVRAPAAEGDYTGYFNTLSTRLNQKVSADARDLSEAALKNLLRDTAFLNTLCQRTLMAKYGVGHFEAFAKADPSNRTFLFWLLQNTPAMDLYLLGAAPVGLAQRGANNYGLPGRSLEIWKRIYHADPESRQGLYLRLAIATALRPPGTGNRGAGMQENPSDPVVRYNYFKSAHKNRELFPSFDGLSVWELTHVVSSCASESDLTWGREMVNTWVPQLREGEKVVDTTSQVWYRNSPIPFTNGFKSVMEGGGKCGPRSSWGVFICQAFGIPAIGVAQPAHACVAYRLPDGSWQVAYGKGWGASRLEGLSGGEFLEGAKARSHSTQFSQVEHLRWLASALASQEQAAVLAVAQKIALAAPPIDTIPFARSATAAKPATRPDLPLPAAPGVIRVEAKDFFDQGGEHAFGGQHRGVPVVDSYTGGKQLHFQALMPSAWVGYKVNVPATGVYEMATRVATVNSGQGLYVRSFGTMAPVKNATASAVFKEMVKDLGSQQAIDNNPGTRWAVNEGVDQAWLELDLGRPTTINTVMIDERMWNRVSKFQVEYKVGNEWKKIFEGTNIGIDFSTDFPPVTAQQVRLNILDCRGSGGPTIWEFNVGTVKDGRAWIGIPCTYGLWHTTKPVDIRLVKGPQTLWIFAPYQRGVSLKWFELKPKDGPTGALSLVE